MKLPDGSFLVLEETDGSLVEVSVFLEEMSQGGWADKVVMVTAGYWFTAAALCSLLGL